MQRSEGDRGQKDTRSSGRRCVEVEMHGDQTISYLAERDWDGVRREAQSIRKVQGVYVLRFGAIYEVTTVRHYLVVPHGLAEPGNES